MRVTFNGPIDSYIVEGDHGKITEGKDYPECVEIGITDNGVVRFQKSMAVEAAIAIMRVAGYTDIEVTIDAARSLSPREQIAAEYRAHLDSKRAEK